MQGPLVTPGFHVAHQLLLLQKSPLSSSLTRAHRSRRGHWASCLPAELGAGPFAQEKRPDGGAVQELVRRPGRRLLGRGPGPCGGLSPSSSIPARGSSWTGLSLCRTEGPVVRTGRLLDQVYAGSLLSAAVREDKLESRRWTGIATPRDREADHAGPPPAPQSGTDTEEETGLRPAPSPAWEVATTLLSPQQPLPSAITRPDAQAASRRRGPWRTHPWGRALSPALRARVSWGWSPKAWALGGEQTFLQMSFCLKRDRSWQETRKHLQLLEPRGRALGVGPGQAYRCRSLGTGPRPCPHPVRHRREHPMAPASLPSKVLTTGLRGQSIWPALQQGAAWRSLRLS